MTSVSAMVRLVVDGFGLAMLPPAIVQKELASGSVSVLRIDSDMPNMSLICSYRSRSETRLFQQIAIAAQQSAQDFARGLPGEVARMPSTEVPGDPWALARP